VAYTNPYTLADATLVYYWLIVPGNRRVNVVFSESAYVTLADLSYQTGHSMSEVLRDAIKLYRWFEEERAQGGRILVEKKTGAIRELMNL
jgi:hypothetical protein